LEKTVTGIIPLETLSLRTKMQHLLTPIKEEISPVIGPGLVLYQAGKVSGVDPKQK